jgi:hypothetical protein
MLQVQKDTVRLNDDATNPQVNDELTIVGFGSTVEDGPGSDILLEAKVGYVDPQLCVQALVPYIVPEDSMMCAVGDGIDT